MACRPITRCASLAVLAANGDTTRASAAAAPINPDLLAPGEYALILPLRTTPANGE